MPLLPKLLELLPPRPKQVDITFGPNGQVLFGGFDVTNAIEYNSVYELTKHMSSIDNAYKDKGDRIVWNARRDGTRYTKSGKSAQRAFWNKAFYEHYGWTPSAARKCINACLWRYWFVGIEKWVKRFAARYMHVGGGKVRVTYNLHVLNCIRRASYHLKRIEQDRLDHLAPLVIALVMSPHDMRELFGKSLWRRLSHNSLSRNWLIAKYWLDNPGLLNGPREFFGILQSVPSTLLAKDLRVYPGYLELIPECLRIRGNIPMKEYPISFAQTLLIDTVRMADQLGEAMPQINSLPELHAAHDRFVAAGRYGRQTPQHSTISKDAVPEWYKPFDMEIDGYMFRLLKTREELEVEGTEMHHCVGMYYHEVYRGQYFILSCRKGTEKIATLGFRRGYSLTATFEDMGNNKLGLVIDQAYGVCNTKLSAEHLVLVCKAASAFERAYKDVLAKL